MKKMYKGTDVQYVPDCNVALFKSKGYAVEGELPPQQDTPPLGADGENSGQENGDAEDNSNAEPDKLVCPICGKKYASQASLDRHIKEKHPQE